MSIYQLINIIIKINIVTVQDIYIFLNIEKFIIEFAKIKIKLIINFYLKYN